MKDSFLLWLFQRGWEGKSESMCANTEIKVYCRKTAKNCCVLLSVTADKGALLYFCRCDINTRPRATQEEMVYLAYPSMSQPIMKPSQGRGTQGRSPEAGTGAETWKGAAYWLAPHGLLTLLLIQTRTPCPVLQ